MSILLVLAAHTKRLPLIPESLLSLINRFVDGGLGVRIFFTISGFIITTLLIREKRSFGRNDLKAFYIRRSLRILPAYFLYIIVLMLLAAGTNFSLLADEWVRLLTFTVAFETKPNWAIMHIWSLSCEEQFYLVWPILFALIYRDDNRRNIYLFLAVSLLVSPCCRLMEHLNPTLVDGFTYRFALVKNLDGLLVGATLSLFHPRLANYWQRGRSVRFVMIAMFIIVVPYMLNFREYSWGPLYMIGAKNLVQAVGIATLLSISMACPDRSLARLLNVPIMIWLGKLSYSLYIWQQLFTSLPQDLGGNYLPLNQFPICVIPIFIAATTSYYFLEKPVLKYKRRFLRTNNIFEAESEPMRVVNAPHRGEQARERPHV